MDDGIAAALAAPSVLGAYIWRASSGILAPAGRRDSRETRRFAPRRLRAATATVPRGDARNNIAAGIAIAARIGKSTRIFGASVLAPRAAGRTLNR
jgi:hypothetical protein